MSLITRCPACATKFKVVRDQLLISGGWVRCGHCAEVFDATLHLVTAEGPVMEHHTAVKSVRAATPVPAPAEAKEAGRSGAAAARVPPPLEAVMPTLTNAPVPEAVTAPAPPQASQAALPSLRTRLRPTSVLASTLPPVPSAAPASAAVSDEAPVSKPHDADRGTGRELPPASSPVPHSPAPGVPWTASELQAWREQNAARKLERARAQQAASDVPKVDERPRGAPAVESRMAAAPAEPPPSSGPLKRPLRERADRPMVPLEPAGSPAVSTPAATRAGIVPGDAGVPEAVEPPPATQAQVAAQPAEAPLFIAQARRRAFWASRPVRAALWLLALLLSAGLVLQWAIGHRDWLAAREPRLTPLLQALCQPLSCTLAPYRTTEAVVIDSSAFNRVNADTFRFSVTLRNVADMPVATPALELTLHDALEQPLVRRVVSVSELGAPAALAARGEFSATHLLTVTDIPNPSAIVGYRLLAFHP
ncbi:DUF3426 domain-containing protein [Ottowia testudinis]|uniref:DUF3426 domain-containing protein n=1 Tax=Ottowia testudinis TaxID=2816950 RepID=A0A975CKU1_9BURK|nr:DUF3426 domain-containing protein [Ottowia testudinis]QTD47454.1 DUF3426 domain-containing protein [Ottowia testudinis]